MWEISYALAVTVDAMFWKTAEQRSKTTCAQRWVLFDLCAFIVVEEMETSCFLCLPATFYLHKNPTGTKKTRDTGHFIVGGKRKELEHTKPNMNRRAATYLLF